MEFVTLTWFDDMDAVAAFSHDGARGAVVPPEARALLARWDDESRHYDLAVEPGADPG